MKRRWSDLTERERRLIGFGAALEGVLKTAAIIDLRRRSADQVRGPKWAWGSAVLVTSSAGLVPLAYFFFGRRGRH